MAKNCYKCSLPIKSEHPYLTCMSCSINSIHKSCTHIFELAQSCDSVNQWICSSCDTIVSAQNSSSCDTCNSYVGKLDELLLRIKNLQEEQKLIVDSIVNTCNDTIGEYETSINKVSTLLSSLHLQLDSFNEEQEDDQFAASFNEERKDDQFVTSKVEEAHSSKDK